MRMISIVLYILTLIRAVVEVGVASDEATVVEVEVLVATTKERIRQISTVTTRNMKDTTTAWLLCPRKMKRNSGRHFVEICQTASDSQVPRRTLAHFTLQV